MLQETWWVIVKLEIWKWHSFQKDWTSQGSNIGTKLRQHLFKFNRYPLISKLWKMTFTRSWKVSLQILLSHQCSKYLIFFFRGVGNLKVLYFILCFLKRSLFLTTLPVMFYAVCSVVGPYKLFAIVTQLYKRYVPIIAASAIRLCRIWEK